MYQICPISSGLFVAAGKAVRREIALALMRDALETARELDADIWEFAVEIEELHRAGVTNTDLRWLLYKGHVHSAIESPIPGRTTRSFHPLVDLCLPPKTCFVLNAENFQFPVTIAENPGVDKCSGVLNTLGLTQQVDVFPLWNQELRQLRWRDQLVKEFRLPAKNQERILNAFQEEGWPIRIDDPLPQVQDQSSKSRLHDAIKSLNHHQVNRLLRFRGDGLGEGIIWEPTST